MNLRYLLHSGKNSNLKFYVEGYLRHCIPKSVYVSFLPNMLKKADTTIDKQYLQKRVDYYCKVGATQVQSMPSLRTLSDFNRRHQNAYYLDLYRTSRWFPGHLRCGFIPGDVTETPTTPSIVKSRPIQGDNANSVILKLDSARHFLFIKDKIPFHDKENKILFRGQAYNKKRLLFMEKYFGHPMVDAGIPSSHHRENHLLEWRVPAMTISDHLRYKFIMAIEGNDVASNLKWVMSSNSVAVMPRPEFETWFMEGTLIPNYHYIEIKSDYSDLEERVNYYIEHEDEALEIIHHAHEYVEQFKNKNQEKLIEIKVLNKYFYGK